MPNPTGPLSPNLDSFLIRNRPNDHAACLQAQSGGDPDKHRSADQNRPASCPSVNSLSKNMNCSRFVLRGPAPRGYLVATFGYAMQDTIRPSRGPDASHLGNQSGLCGVWQKINSSQLLCIDRCVRQSPPMIPFPLLCISTFLVGVYVRLSNLFLTPYKYV